MNKLITATVSNMYSIKTFELRQYLTFIMGRLDYNQSELGRALGGSRAMVSDIMRNDRKYIKKTTYRAMRCLAVNNGLPVYETFCDDLRKECEECSDKTKEVIKDFSSPAPNKELLTFDLDEISEMDMQHEGYQNIVVEVSVPEISCVACRFVKSDDSNDNHYSCVLFEKALYSNGAGDILKLKECE